MTLGLTCWTISYAIDQHIPIFKPVAYFNALTIKYPCTSINLRDIAEIYPSFKLVTICRTCSHNMLHHIALGTHTHAHTHAHTHTHTHTHAHTYTHTLQINTISKYQAPGLKSRGQESDGERDAESRPLSNCTDSSPEQMNHQSVVYDHEYQGSHQ